jgi:hypothetical protein
MTEGVIKDFLLLQYQSLNYKDGVKKSATSLMYDPKESMRDSNCKKTRSKGISNFYISSFHVKSLSGLSDITDFF